MPINSAPVDQGAFTRLMLVSIEPKNDRETGVQFTSKDGRERKWTVQVVASLPSRWDPERSDSEVLPVTVTCEMDPRDEIAEGDPVHFGNLSVGVMPPEHGENNRIRGGKLFWQATAVHSRVPVSKPS